MVDDAKSLAALEALLTKLVDIQNSQEALIQKLAGLQLQASEASLDSLADRLGTPFSNASSNRDLITEIVRDVESERNRLKTQASS